MDSTMIKYSIDNGKAYQVPPIEYTVMEENEAGKLVEVKKIATPDMYTHIQWMFLKPLYPAEDVTLKYRVQMK
jgi:hypothetical protein